MSLYKFTRSSVVLDSVNMSARIIKYRIKNYIKYIYLFYQLIIWDFLEFTSTVTLFISISRSFCDEIEDSYSEAKLVAMKIHLLHDYSTNCKWNVAQTMHSYFFTHTLLLNAALEIRRFICRWSAADYSSDYGGISNIVSHMSLPTTLRG